MLTALGRAAVRYRRWILVIAAFGFVYAAVFGGPVAGDLSAGGFQDHGSASMRAEDRLDKVFTAGPPNLVLLVTAKSGNVDDTAVAKRGTQLSTDLARETHIEQAVSYWSLGSPPPLRSKDGNQALVLAKIAGTQNEVLDRVKSIAPRYLRDDGVISVRVGGFAQVFHEVQHQIRHDLERAETVTLPVVLVLLVIVFGSVVAGSLPLAIGALAVVGTFLALRVLAQLTEVSVFSLNLATGMGLGLAVDYSLFVVSRYREEIGNGLEPHAAVVRSIETAGRTVTFSALTVAAALCALLIFPLAFLRSFAYAGIGVVLIASLGAVVVLPAMLAALGPRVDKWVLFRHRQHPVGEGFWHRVATFVMHRPIPVAAVVIALLLFLGTPFLRVNFGLPDDRVLPTSAPARQVQDQLRRNFSSQEAAPLEVVSKDIGDPRARRADIDRYAIALSELPHVGRVDALTGSYIAGARVPLPDSPISLRFLSPRATWLSVVPSVEPMSDAAKHLVHAVRDTPAPFPVLVGGQSAELVDGLHSLFARVPMAGVIIAIITFAVLFLMTGSVLVPAKALVLNLLSLSATFGAMVWIFQDGHLSKLLDFTPTGALDTTTPILMFCVAFGLSMDYEVFLLSRIKEEYDRTGDNISSVAMGLERTGRIVTAAGALLAVVFIAFGTSKISFIQLFGVGLALAVIMDTTLVRAALVPAFMRLAGNANWWAPGPLRRFHDRYGFKESGSFEAELRHLELPTETRVPELV